MSSPDSPRSRRRIVIWLALAAVLLLAGGAGAYVLLSGGDVSNPDVEFRTEPTETPAPEPANKRADFLWPLYGYSQTRRHYLPAPGNLRPPFKRTWSWNAHSLLEFTPVIAEGKLFVIKNNGGVYAISQRNGKPAWRRDMGRLAASAPAYADGRIYVTILKRDRRSKGGRVAALRAKDGKVMWSKPLPSRTESSPLFAGGNLYFGSEDGTVYALRAKDGSVVWRFKAGGAVKGAPALADGRLYFGDYAGVMYCIRQSNGRRVWSKATRGAHFGTSSGQFYASPAVAYGRVYIGNTDSNVYSFSAATGKLAWRTGTGGYVYASAAVAQVPGGKPTVYVGSYDSRFYALDAKTGRVRWKHRAPGRISGAATVVGDIVYFGDLQSRSTTGLGANTGRKIFRYKAGGFNPVVSDERYLYVVGYSSLSRLKPR